MKEFVYRVARPAAGHFPGHHKSRRGDSGQEFRAHVPLQDAPDARRLDLHASLRSPFVDHWLVRVASERKAVPVYAVADLSPSMAYEGERRKLDVMADFVEALAWSAWRTGDAFGFLGCDDAPRRDFLMPLMRARAAGASIAQRLRHFEPTGHGAGGLRQAHRLLRSERSLVFLLSDFHFPLEEVEASFASLARHELVPVVLWDRAEFDPPAAGAGRLAPMIDAETGRQRLLWLRASVRKRWRALQDERREALEALCRRQRVRPLFLLDGFDADAVTAHFHR